MVWFVMGLEWFGMVHFVILSASPDGQASAGGIETKASTAQMGIEAGTGAKLGNILCLLYLK